MKKNKFNVGVGDYVFIDGYSSFCVPYIDKVIDIDFKYDEDTGEPYERIHTDEHIFDGRDGESIKGASAYYLAHKSSEKEYFEMFPNEKI